MGWPWPGPTLGQCSCCEKVNFAYLDTLLILNIYSSISPALAPPAFSDSAQGSTPPIASTSSLDKLHLLLMRLTLMFFSVGPIVSNVDSMGIIAPTVTGVSPASAPPAFSGLTQGSTPPIASVSPASGTSGNAQQLQTSQHIEMSALPVFSDSAQSSSVLPVASTSGLNFGSLSSAVAAALTR